MVTNQEKLLKILSESMNEDNNEIEINAQGVLKGKLKYVKSESIQGDTLNLELGSRLGQEDPQLKVEKAVFEKEY